MTYHFVSEHRSQPVPYNQNHVIFYLVCHVCCTPWLTPESSTLVPGACLYSFQCQSPCSLPIWHWKCEFCKGVAGGGGGRAWGLTGTQNGGSTLTQACTKCHFVWGLKAGWAWFLTEVAEAPLPPPLWLDLYKGGKIWPVVDLTVLAWRVHTEG